MIFPQNVDTADQWPRGHGGIQTVDNPINIALTSLARENHEKEMSLNRSYPVDSIAVPSEPLKISDDRAIPTQFDDMLLEDVRMERVTCAGMELMRCFVDHHIHESVNPPSDI